MSDGARRDRLGRLLRRIQWLLPLVVMLASAGLTAVFYFMQVKPLAEAVMTARASQVADRVAGQLTSLRGQIERVLLTTRDWAGAGLLSLNDPLPVDRLLMPILRQRSVMGSVHYAREDGLEVMLLKTGQGWKNRLSDLPGRGRAQRWLEWRDGAAAPDSDSVKDQDYDPRKRPWLTGALASPPGEPYWTPPYQFNTTKEPGITASVRWLGPDHKSHIVAYDVTLTELTELTQSLRFGEHGYVALLTGDGKLLGLPKHPSLNDAEAIRAGMLKTPEALGLRQIVHVLALAGQGEALLRWVDAEGAWLASTRPLSLRNQSFRVVSIAPQADFTPLTDRLLWTLAALAALTLAIALLLSHGVARRIGAPLAEIFAELSASTRQLSAQVEAKTLAAKLVAALQQTDSPARCGEVALSHLAPQLRAGQAMLALAAADGGLAVLARYGASPTARQRQAYAPNEGLAGQCAADRRPHLLKLPEDPAWRIRSGLGSAAPAESHALPVLHGDRLVAVLELALIQPLDAAGRLLLEETLPALALRLHALRDA